MKSEFVDESCFRLQSVSIVCHMPTLPTRFDVSAPSTATSGVTFTGCGSRLFFRLAASAELSQLGYFEAS